MITVEREIVFPYTDNIGIDMPSCEQLMNCDENKRSELRLTCLPLSIIEEVVVLLPKIVQWGCE